MRNVMKAENCQLAGAEVIRGSSLQGSPNSPIFLTGLSCQIGINTNILDCEAAVLGITRCVHKQDAAVHCEGTCVTSILSPSSSYVIIVTNQLPHKNSILSSGCDQYYTWKLSVA